MKSYLSKYGYVLDKSELGEEEISKLLTDLRGRPLVDDKYAVRETSFPLYINGQTKLYIPKIYGIQHYGKDNVRYNSNYIGKAWTEGIEFVGTLRDNQKEPVDVLYNELVNGSGGGILSLATGFGKTFCTLAVLAKLGRKAIIIVNKIALLKQWESEIKAFLPDAKIGIIQGQKKVESSSNVDIIIAMLQSMAKIDYPMELFNDVSVTVVDECHNTSSRVFSKVLMKMSSQYTIGLSATPVRSDGCEYVFKWFLGDVVYTSKMELDGLPPIISTIRLDSKDYTEVKIMNKATGEFRISFTSMLSELIKMNERNELIIKLIKEYSEQGRKILVLSDRREHLKDLKSRLDKDEGITFTYGLFIGQMKIADLEQSKRCGVILATYNAFGEGVSERDLDTLILTTPKKFIGHLENTAKNESGKLEQIVGRIFRKTHTERSPLIVDLQDNFSIYRAQSKQRQQFYKSHFSFAIVKAFKVNLKDVNDLPLDQLLQRTKNAGSGSTETSASTMTATPAVYNSCLLD